MYKELAVCRAIMRLYTFLDIDTQTNTIKTSDAPDFLHPYLEIEPFIKNAFQDVGIELHPSGVISCFNKEIRTVLEVAFIHTDHCLKIPDKISQILSMLLRIEGREHQNPMPQTLYWAYSGRFMDKVTNQYFVTDGLQSLDNRIFIDFLTYSTASPVALHYRVIHELLHTLGITENEMPLYIHSASSLTFEFAKSFTQHISNQIPMVMNAFTESLYNFEINNPDLVRYLLKLGDDLYEYGFPCKMDCPIYTTTYLPYKLSPHIHTEGYNVLLM